MSMQKSTSKRNIILIVLGAVLLIALGIAAYLYFTPKTATTEPDTTNYAPPTSEETKQGQDIKKQIVEEDLSKNEQADTPKKTFSQQITTAEKTDGTLYVRNEIAGVYQSGTCTLTLVNGSKTVKKTAGVQALAKTSTCKGFNIPVSELSSGTWDLILSVTINDMTADDTAKVAL
ncbi:MAG TPA: hypothetical protein PL051_00560 [Candidatus Saccharibacteria bacterium]|nr:hypothetical protein [Candidatus Saccharibacteria bacterium]